MPELVGPLGATGGGILGRHYRGEAVSSSVNQILDSFQESGEYASPEIAVALLAVEAYGREPQDVFRTYEGSLFHAEHKQLSQFLTVHSIRRQIREASSNTREVGGYIAALTYSDSALILTTRDSMELGKNFTDFRDHCLVEWVDRFYPDLDVVRFSSRSLVEFLRMLDEEDDASLRLLRSTMRFPGGGRQETEKVETLDTVLARLDDEGGFLDRVTLQLDHESGYTASVARSGLALYHAGSLRGFLQDLQELLTDARSRTASIRDLFNGESGSRPAAIEVGFVRSLSLSDERISQRLVELLDENQLYSVTLLHGNPYMHIAVTDLAHGANYTVFSHGGDRVRIYPGVSADRSSLGHLVAWLSQSFSDVAEIDVCGPGAASSGSPDHG